MHLIIVLIFVERVYERSNTLAISLQNLNAILFSYTLCSIDHVARNLSFHLTNTCNIVR